MASEGREDNEVREITIGWQPVALVLLLILVVIAGFMFGNLLGGPSTQTAAQPADAGGAANADPASQPPQAVGDTSPGFIVRDSSGQILESPIQGNLPAQAPGASQGQDLSSQFRPDIVYDLPQRSHPMRGQVAPDFTMTDLDTGEEVSLSDYAGQPVFIDFWATWCPPCRIEMPWIQSVHEKYADDGLVVLGFNAGEKVPASMVEQTIRDFVSSSGLTFPILIGDNHVDIQRQWSVMGYPSAYFVSRDGLIVDIHQGMFPNQVTLESKLEQTILAGTSADG